MWFPVNSPELLSLTSDVLLVIGATGAALYCVVLARRLKKFNDLKSGMGGAVAVLSVQVDDMTRTLDSARLAAAESSKNLTELTERAEASARKLELMLASLHDLPDLAQNSELKLDEDWEAQARTSSSVEEPLFSSKRGITKEAIS